MRVYAGANPLVGRTQEAAMLTEAFQRLGATGPRVALVHGEPGIGKTRLVSDLCVAEGQRDVPVLWAQCVQAAAAVAPYLPLLLAFDHWRADAPPGAPDVSDLVEALGGEGTASSTTRLVRLLEAALAALTEKGPVVLVVDDVHWADTSTLDLLAYTVAACRPLPLTVVLTYRDTELGDGHRLHGWLGDLRRLPDVVDVHLRRLSRPETEELAGRLLGRVPPMTLVDAVHERSDGNPYLTELLLRSLPDDATELPPGMPADLRAALLGAWHRLRPGARDVTRLLAVAGRPVARDSLTDVAAHLGLRTDVGLGLDEAATGGLVVDDAAGDAWFHHPLLAEVLYRAVSDPERRRLHAAFVAAWDRRARSEPALSAHLARHCEEAGLLGAAFSYALAAARQAASLRALPEEATALLRAANLWEHALPADLPAGMSESGLWCDAAEAASRAGWDDVALDAATKARRAMDADRDPAGAARALRLHGYMRGHAGRPFPMPVDDDREAVRLSALGNDREEQAVCLASLSESESWAGDVEAAARHATEAVTVATASGSLRALALAMAARCTTRWTTEPSLDDADEAMRLALASDDVEAIGHACLTRANALESLHRFGERAEEFQRGYARSVEHGFGRQQRTFAAYAAQALMDVARYDEARQLLREALAVPSSGAGGIAARLNSVVLEIYSGDVDAAAHHLSRARELAPDLEASAPHAVMKYHLATGRPDLAVEVADRPFPPQSLVDADAADWTLMLAATATGDVATATDPAVEDRIDFAREALRALLTARAGLGGEMFEPRDEIARTHGIILKAELARAFGDPDEPDLWVPLRAIPDWYGEDWMVTLALLHWAQALARVRAPRRETAVPLRRAHARAVTSGFGLLRRDIEILARNVGVPLEGGLPGQRTGSEDGGVSLTRREHEVLGHLASGRSYAEIADSLFISQKTVSVHVSHILQKSGTSSRAEAAAWAWRHGLVETG